MTFRNKIIRKIGFFESREKYRYAKPGTNKIQKFQASRLFIATACIFGVACLSQLLPSIDTSYTVSELQEYSEKNVDKINKF
jgi:hypothetical protein